MTAPQLLLGVSVPGSCGWLALGLGLVLGLVAWRQHDRLARVPLRLWTLSWALVAALVSMAYVHWYLRGGPRIIDATSYWLQARALSEGLFSWPVLEPTASFRGRFLLFNEAAPGPSMGVIFPPGYAAVLSLGMRAGVPMLVGPVVGALLVIATAGLAHAATASEQVARLAAVLSALSVALRYHTADTMSHGLAASLLVTSLWWGMLAVQATGARGGNPIDSGTGSGSFWRAPFWIGAGVAAGMLAATRPATAASLALVTGPVLAWLVLRRRRFDALLVGLGAALPLALLVSHQRAVTGQWWTSTQMAYYLVADGPPGCFRYGFGEGIGCMAEHGDYVRTVLPHGLDALAVIKTMGRRLAAHLGDATNFAPLTLLAVAGAWLGRRQPKVLLLALVPFALLLGYAPFYFDGSYPGAGGRLYAEAIPCEQVLIAVAAVGWSQAFVRRSQGFGWALGLTMVLPLAGFGLHRAHQHELLRDRDGGRPMYEPSVVRDALGDAPRGLLFAGTDHGFNLAHDPKATDASRQLVVARLREDARDWLLWDRLGRPPAWKYVFDPWGKPDAPRLQSYEPQERVRFEAEAEWPVLAQHGGYAAPVLLPDACVSRGRALAIVKTAPDRACVSLSLPMSLNGRALVQTWLVLDGPLADDVNVEVVGAESVRRVDRAGQSHGLASAGSPGRPCVLAAQHEVGGAVGARLRVCSRRAWIAVDRVEVRAPATQAP